LLIAGMARQCGFVPEPQEGGVNHAPWELSLSLHHWVNDVLMALFYALFNHGEAGAVGWGIPMATDIAFAIGVLRAFTVPARPKYDPGGVPSNLLMAKTGILLASLVSGVTGFVWLY